MTGGDLFVGLMSGTSIDGIDAVLVRIDGDSSTTLSWSLLAFSTTAYDEDRRKTILEALEEGTPDTLCRLHASLGEWFASAVHDVCEAAGVESRELAAIGSHGQTVWHIPPSDVLGGATLQLGDAATLAERTGAPVISDFRSRDVAAGGHGAPLVPWLDQLLFSAVDRRRAIQNLGGMANVTWLPPTGSPEPVIAFDTGPGVVLIDGAVRRASDGALPYDRDGVMALRGQVDESLLTELLDDAYFRAPPPKSTGREHFGRVLLDRVAEGLNPGTDEEAWCDLVATLTAFTARSIAEAYRSWVLPRGLDEIFLVGGGTNNPALVQAITRELAPVPVRDGGDLGVDPDAREALAFAFLAWAHLHQITGNIPSVTGAEAPRVLGSLTPGAQA
ncbi:MAG: anhydro-N-acetylmuramic acid kinase [Gemmatimonadetes bacterium]|nr:anhydro-N-acetylmuramic acid kinase [Gemmatimonadota bacterium]